MADDAPLSTTKDSKARRQQSGPDGDALVGCTVTINRPRQDIYAFWRDVTNLPRVMENVTSITRIDDRRSRWVVEAPGGAVEWTSTITEDQPGRLIAWEADAGAEIRNSGRIEFRDAPPGRGTEVTAIIAFDPPAGTVGRLVAKLFQKEPGIQARRDLRRLQQYLETGEIATSTPPNPPPAA